MIYSFAYWPPELSPLVHMQFRGTSSTPQLSIQGLPDGWIQTLWHVFELVSKMNRSLARLCQLTLNSVVVNCPWKDFVELSLGLLDQLIGRPPLGFK